MKYVSFVFILLALVRVNFIVAQSTPMAGNYTINPLGGDFASFNEAIDSLEARGVSAPVIISAASGTYNESMVITPVSGASAINTITFTSATGINTDVTIQDAVSSAKNYVIYLNGADYIQFRNLTIQTLTSASFYGRVIVMDNKCVGNVFDNNKIIGSYHDNESSGAQVIFMNAGANMNNVLSNNEILKGSHGIYLQGNYVPYKSGGNKIINNKIRNWTCKGIYMIYNDSITVSGNEISNGPGGTSTMYGIHSVFPVSGCLFSNNTIKCSSTNNIFGLYLSSNFGNTDSVFNHVNNNMITVAGTGQNYGLHLEYSSRTNICFNSVNLINSSADSYSLFTYQGSSGLTLLNNIFSNYGAGYALYRISGVIDTMDFNNYFSNGDNLIHWGSDYSSLAQFQAVSNYDSLSVSFDPMFVADTNLHIQQAHLYVAGETVDYISTDIDGDLRKNPPTIGADEYVPLAYDIALIEFDQPMQINSGSSETISIRMQNLSSDTLTAALIGWSMNDSIQPSVLWTGSLLSGDVADSVVLFNGPFSTGVYHLKAWVELVNGNGDMSQVNDMVEYSFTVCNSPLHGDYYIGPGRNYRYFNDAVTVLEGCGVDSVVVFYVDSGEYNEKISIDPIFGSSVTNTVTFESASGVKTDVVLQNSNTGYSDDYVVQLKGADYFVFRNMTFRLLPSPLTRVVSVESGSNNNIFDNNIIKSVPGSGSSFDYNSAVSISDNNNNVISNNEIFSGSTGVNCDNGLNNTISNNVISGWENTGIYTEANDSLYIINNEVSDTSVSYGSGIIGKNNYHGCVFSGNKILLYNGIGSNNYGFYFINDTYFTSDTIPILIYNNFIAFSPDYMGTASFYYGFYLQNMSYLDILFNSVSIEGLSTSYCFYETNSLGHINIMNNIFTNWGYGYAYYIKTPNKITISDYNDYYSPTNKLIYWGADYYDISSLSAVSGKDSSSMIVPPFFASETDLHCHQTLLYGSGCDIAGIDSDIDSDQRNVPPSIGADEIIVSDYDCGITTIVLPSDTILVQSPQTLTVRIKNLGTETLSSIPVAFVPDSTLAPIVETWAGTLLPGQTTEFAFSATFTPTFGSNDINCCAYTMLASDTIGVNDTTYKTIFVSDIIDCGIVAIISPSTVVPNYSIQQVTGVIQNFGTDTSTLIPVTYKLESNPTITYFWTGNLAPNDTAIFCFSFDPIYVTDPNGFSLCTYISLTDDQDNSNDTMCIDVLIESITENTLAENISISPNPADEYFVLKFTSPSCGQGTINIVSQDGRIALSKPVAINKDESQITIETGELNPGLYFLKIENGGSCIGTGKIVVE